MDPIVNAYPKHTPTSFPSNPYDREWNVATRRMAGITCPSGWDQVERFEDAPTSLQAVIEYANRVGRLCIAMEDSDGTLYDCADTNHHLRAWHDSVHYRHQLQFNVAGEAAAVYVQCAQLLRVYGDSGRTRDWMRLLLADIVGLVLYHQRTKRWPKNKRGGTLNEAKLWGPVAAEIAEAYNALEDKRNHEEAALLLARKTWGDPYVSVA